MTLRLAEVPFQSVIAFKLLKLSSARERVLRIVQENPNSTARELELVTGHRKLNARLAELKRMGLVEETQVRVCTVSGRPASEWRDIPGAIPKPVERAVPARIRIEQLEAQVERLQRELDSANQKLAHAMKQVGKQQEQSYLDFGGDL
jgi:hypothetical protein